MDTLGEGRVAGASRPSSHHHPQPSCALHARLVPPRPSLVETLFAVMWTFAIFRGALLAFALALYLLLLALRAGNSKAFCQKMKCQPHAPQRHKPQRRRKDRTSTQEPPPPHSALHCVHASASPANHDSFSLLHAMHHQCTCTIKQLGSTHLRLQDLSNLSPWLEDFNEIEQM